jgi:hypothetical protein
MAAPRLGAVRLGLGGRANLLRFLALALGATLLTSSPSDDGDCKDDDCGDDDHDDQPCVHVGLVPGRCGK